MLKQIQQDIVSWFKLGQFVEVTYAPSSITNLTVGMTGFVEKTPQIEGNQIFVPVKFSNGKVIVCNSDFLELKTSQKLAS